MCVVSIAGLNMSTVISHSEAETKQIAKDFALNLHPGDIVTLTGELGAGKTAFTKGIAEALGIQKEIVSPTFTILNVHDASGKNNQKSKIISFSSTKMGGHKSIKQLIHIDTYRLKSADELLAIGADEYIGADNIVTIIEWPELAEPLLKNKKIKTVTLEHQTDGSRKITVNQ